MPNDDDWAQVLSIFKPPWRILRRENGAVRIEDAAQRPFVFIHHRGLDWQNWKKPSEEEAVLVAKAIAKMSKQEKA
jgi:hypothetical protein